MKKKEKTNQQETSAEQKATGKDNSIIQGIFTNKAIYYILATIGSIVLATGFFNSNIQNVSNGGSANNITGNSNIITSADDNKKKEIQDEDLQTSKKFYGITNDKFKNYQKDLNLSEAVLNDFIKKCYENKVSFEKFDSTLKDMAKKYQSL